MENRGKLILEYFSQHLLKVISLLLILIYLYLPIINIEDGKIGLLILLMSSIILIYKARNFKPLAIMFFYWFTYSFVLVNYYYNGEDISGGYNIFDQVILYNETLRIHLLFVLTVVLLFPQIRTPIYLKDKMNGLQSNFFYFLTFAFMLFIALYGATGESILESGGYGKSETENLGGTSIFEYFVVLVPLLFLFSSNSKPQRFFFWLLVLLYCAKSLSMGYRNQVIQIGLVCFCLFDNPKFKYWHLITIGSIPLYLLSIFGAIRQNPLILFSNDINDILFLPFENVFNVLGNQSDVYYSTVRMYGLIEIGVIDAIQRSSVGLYNLLAFIVPYSFLPDIANLAAYKKDAYGAGGGGLISMYWYVFAGYIGVFIIASYIAFIIKKIVKSENIYFVIYMILVLSTYLRWFAYNQISLFKICFYGILYYSFLILVKKIIFLFKKPELV